MSEPTLKPTGQPKEAAVVVPSRGGAQRLPRLVRAFAAQQDAPSFEVHVVLDGDIDDSAGVLEQLAAEHSDVDLAWTVFPENRGRVEALNAGADATTGRILIRCDDDLEPGPHYIRDHVNAHADGPSGAVGLYLNVLEDTAYTRVYGAEQDVAHREHAYALPAGEQWRHWAGNVSVPRSVHEEIGGYDPDYRRYGWEDIDYGYRVHSAGYPVRIRSELATPHHIAAVTTQIKARRAMHGQAARETFVAKHGASALGSVGAPTGLWGLAVRAVGAVTTEAVLERTSAGVDRIIDRLPRKLAKKLVALQVEGAAEAGRVHPDRAARHF